MNKDSSPKIHLYEEIDLRGVTHLLGHFNGKKYQVSIKTLIDEIDNLKQELEKLKNKVEKPVDLVALDRVNLIGNKVIEKNASIGDTYTDGETVKIKMNKGWQKFQLT